MSGRIASRSTSNIVLLLDTMKMQVGFEALIKFVVLRPMKYMWLLDLIKYIKFPARLSSLDFIYRNVQKCQVGEFESRSNFCLACR